MNQYKPDQLITRRELAATGIASYDKLAADAVKGTGIPHYKIGRKVMYLWGDVLEYLEQNKVRTQNPNNR